MYRFRRRAEASGLIRLLHVSNWNGGAESHKNIICRVVDTRLGSMKAASLLCKKLCQQKTIRHLSHRFGNQLRTHRNLLGGPELASTKVLLHAQCQRQMHLSMLLSACIHGRFCGAGRGVLCLWLKACRSID